MKVLPGDDSFGRIGLDDDQILIADGSDSRRNRPGLLGRSGHEEVRTPGEVIGIMVATGLRAIE